MKRSLNMLALAVTAAFANGCAVTHHETNAKAEALQLKMEREVEKQQPNMHPAKNPLYKRVKAVYVGTKSTAIVNNAALPPAINELSFQLPSRVNLATAAKNIQKLTRYPVRINPDVYTRNAQAADPRADRMSEVPAASNLLSATVPDGDTSLPTDFDGPLKDYLEVISAQLGIHWEFDANKGFYFYRYITKVLEVKLHAGDNWNQTQLRKGTQASTGSQGTSGGSSGAGGQGAYTSTTAMVSTAVYSPWASLDAAIKAAAPNARVATDISSNSIIVRGTREEVDEAERIVQRANEVHNRLVTLTLRMMRVRYDDSSAAGANFQAAYNRLLTGGVSDFQLNFASPSSLVGGDAGGFGYKIVNPESRWNGTQGLVQAINQLGTIVSDETESYPVMNRRTIPVAAFDTDTYLAETTPAAGGGGLGGGGAGVPGLKPGTITTGFFLSMTPTAYDDGTVWLEMTLDQSEKRGAFGTASTGSGDTFQQIQLPNTHVDTKSPTVAVKAGETLMLVNSNRDTLSHSRKSGLLGVSGSGEKRREVQIILITPHVRTL